MVREAVPNLSFELRPFRRDLLEGDDVVRDFASVFLAVDDAMPEIGPERWTNRGLPLEAALLLRGAEPGRFWRSIHDNKTFYPLKKIVLEGDWPETDRAKRGRQILHRYAYATFEAGNAQMINEVGWPTEHFVPPIDSSPNDANAALLELDDVWKTTASEAEKEAFYRELEQQLGPREPTRAPAPSTRTRLAKRAAVSPGVLGRRSTSPARFGSTTVMRASSTLRPRLVSDSRRAPTAPWSSTTTATVGPTSFWGVTTRRVLVQERAWAFPARGVGRVSAAPTVTAVRPVT